VVRRYGSIPEGEAPSEVVSDALVESTGRGCRTEADRGGPPGERPTDEGGTIREAREEHPRSPLLLSFSGSLVGEIESEQGVVGLHWFLLKEFLLTT
jgi:hypothetical protein